VRLVVQLDMYGTCEKCNAGLTIIGACIACREKEGFQAYKEGKKSSENPYNDDDKLAWYFGWFDGLDTDNPEVY